MPINIAIAISIFTFIIGYIIGLVYASSRVNSKIEAIEKDMVNLINDIKNN